MAIDYTSVGRLGNQGTRPMTVLDSHFSSVLYPITLCARDPYPSIILNNLVIDNSPRVMLASGGDRQASSPSTHGPWE